jgi:hypothetical protein
LTWVMPQLHSNSIIHSKSTRFRKWNEIWRNITVSWSFLRAYLFSEPPSTILFCTILHTITIMNLLFYVPLKNFSLIWRRHYYQWRAQNLRPMLGAQGLWAGRDLYIMPHLLWHRASVFLVSSEGPPHSVVSYDTLGGCRGSILTRILMGKNFLTCSWRRYNNRWRPISTSRD